MVHGADADVARRQRRQLAGGRRRRRHAADPWCAFRAMACTLQLAVMLCMQTVHACDASLMQLPKTAVLMGLADETVAVFSIEGVKAEAAYAKDKTLPDPTSTDNPEFQIVLTIIKEVQSLSSSLPTGADSATPTLLRCCRHNRLVST